MITVVIGAPCSGKSTYVRNHKKDGDIAVDFDVLAQALGSDKPHEAPDSVKKAAFLARQAAIDYCLTADCDSWVIHTKPSKKQMQQYQEAGAEFHYMETDLETCLERCQSDERPEGTEDVIREYFEKGNILHKFKEAPSAAEIADGGSVKGYASTFDRDPDAYGDVIAKGAFEKSLKRWEEVGKPIPLLYGHNTDDPEYNIGKVTEIYEDEKGLYIEAEFDADNPKAQYVRKLVKEGRLYQFSFAFDCSDWAEVTLEDGTKANELRELDIFEVSLVQIPANQHAEVTEVKNTEPETKSGRRNSHKDEADIQRIGDLAAEIINVVNGLTETEEQEEANADEPKANADEPNRKLIDEAEQFLKSIKE